MKIFSDSNSLRQRVLVNTGAMASANLWRIVVSFLVQILVARGLGLEALGQYTVAMAYLNISQVLCEMGLPLWLMRELAQAPHLRRAYFRRAVLVQVTAALILWAGLAGLMMLLPYPQVTRWAIFWVGASLPLFAITSASTTIFQAAERMEMAFLIEFVTNLLILLLSVWLLWQQQSVADLLLVVTIAQGIGMLLALGLLFTTPLLTLSQQPLPQGSMPLSWREIATGAMPFFGLSLTDVLLQRLDILLLSLFADARLLGIYSAAYNLVRVAIKLLQSVWRGVYPTLARLYLTTPARASHLATTFLYWGVAICTLGAAMVGPWATPIVRLIYGMGVGGSETGSQIILDNAEVASALAWLIWQAPLFFVEFYATTWLLVIGQARSALFITLFHLCALVVLLPLGAMLYEMQGAVWGTVAAQALGTALALWQLRQRTEKAQSA